MNGAVWGGVVLIGCGLVWTVGALCGWRRITEGSRRVFGIAWVADMFGRGVARVVVGLLGAVLVGLGVTWIARAW